MLTATEEKSCIRIQWCGSPDSVQMIHIKASHIRNVQSGMVSFSTLLSHEFTLSAAGCIGNALNFLYLKRKMSISGSLLMSAGILFQLSITLTLKKLLLSSSLPLVHSQWACRISSGPLAVSCFLEPAGCLCVCVCAEA
jgi:hypothetical protein